MDELGVTQAEAHVLALLARRGPTSIGTLHGELARRRSTLTNILDRLETRGLVRREINREDRRSFVIHLTSPGEGAARQVVEVLDELEREVEAAVTERDRRGLDTVVELLAAKAHQRGIRGT